jgi:hypothetical protein
VHVQNVRIKVTCSNGCRAIQIDKLSSIFLDKRSLISFGTGKITKGSSYIVSVKLPNFHPPFVLFPGIYVFISNSRVERVTNSALVKLLL